METAKLNSPSALRRSGAQPAQRESLRLAAIDVGSNSVHMIVAQCDPDGAITTLWRMKEMVGLGRMSFPSRKLSKESMDRAIVALARFQQAAQQRQCETIIAVATSAIREAENGGDFIVRVKRELGLYIRVISARDEARLIYMAVRHAMPLKDKPHLIIDIGGGSVEFIVGDEHRASVLESRKLGAARMTAQFVKSDPISKDDLKKLLAHYEEVLSPLSETILAHKPVRAIGTSGTLEAISTLCGGETSSNGSEEPLRVIERAPLEELVEKLLESDTKKRANMRGLDDQRRDQIIAGAVLVDQLFKRLHLRRIQICGSALREGILFDYLSRHVPEMTIRREVPDPRRRSVLDLARRCDWHKTHSEHVAKLCLEMFDDLRPLHGLGGIERELIEYGAMLHDIGWHIGREGHHKHSMYLILNGALKNFSDEEIKIIANIARYHRKSEPKKSHDSYISLSSWGRRVVDVGSSLLRLADGLDRSHASAITKIQCKIREDRVKCLLTARSDAELEIWGARRKMDLFEKVFGRKIKFELADLKR
jgi:exopolyphosphatase/guanosine-5'-triphosphate,3'-diphosphate pyrophosphatase